MLAVVVVTVVVLVLLVPGCGGGVVVGGGNHTLAPVLKEIGSTVFMVTDALNFAHQIPVLLKVLRTSLCDEDVLMLQAYVCGIKKDIIIPDREFFKLSQALYHTTAVPMPFTDISM
ncbi:Hypothetical predicted protein [Octopus vulgaris]|uniref:Uncharacterized protein n=1 Tax=Octopus vulgaris TaxID=6645 RepID=A0AA36AQS2_OCTVU|nr:Hypothetical predicted protein [Octopus vulgaris]